MRALLDASFWPGVVLEEGLDLQATMFEPTGLDASYCICTLPLSVLKATQNDLSPRVVSAINQVAYDAGYKIAWESRRFWEQENNIYGGISWLSTGPISLESSVLANVWYPSGGMLSEKGVLVAGYGTEVGEFARLRSMEAKLAASRAAVEKLHPGRGKELTKPLYVPWAKIPFSLDRGSAKRGIMRGHTRSFSIPTTASISPATTVVT